MDKTSICANIRRIRRELGKTQEEMADILNIGRGTYINFESGRTMILSDYVFDIAKLSGYTVEQVLFGPDITPSYLHECADFDEIRKTLREQYQKELDEKEAEIKALNAILQARNATIESERENIRSLNEINNYLRGRIDKLESEKTIDIENNI